MEKEKKSGFKRLGRLFKSRSADLERGGSESSSHDTSLPEEETSGPGDGPNPKELPVSKEHISPAATPAEVKKKPFGSWRVKRKNPVTSSPPSSPGPANSKDRPCDTAEGDQDFRSNSVAVNSTEETFSTQKDLHPTIEENLDKSKASPTESPKKEAPKKPIPGKIFGNLFTTSKKKQIKGVPDSPTSPTNEKIVTTVRSEVVKERKKVHVLTTSSKVQLQASSSVPDPPSQLVTKDSTLPVGQRGNEASNGNSSISLTEQSIETTTVKELEKRNTESPATSSEALSGSSPKSAQTSTSKGDTLITVEKSLRNYTQYAGRRSSTDGETKTTVRRPPTFLQENNQESPKSMTRKTSRFSGKVSESKYKISDKPPQKLGSTDKLNTTKSLLQLPTQGDTQGLTSPPAEQSLPLDVGDTSAAVSPSESDPFTGTPQDKSKGHSSNGLSPDAKVLTVDIYLSKTAGANSPTATRTYSNGDSMERRSPTSKKINKRRRSYKSQSSQNDEKKTESTALPDDVFDDGSFKSTQEPSSISPSNIKPAAAPLSPESSSAVSANPEIKAGANHKVSPKGESDKDKQQHPASSPVRKKAPWVPSSPTVRKAQARDPVFRNSAVAAAAKVSEYNQPVSVTTTKDAYVEKSSVLGSLTGSRGQDLNNSTGDISSAAGVSTQDKPTKQESIQGVQAQQTSSTNGSHSPTQNSNSDTVKTPFNDSSKSTVTSKLNIPPRPKNVELPIKPRAAGAVDEPTIEVPIPKGNIASKVSLFESKKTSHRQIDFYATKNISQPKKFVERAKINFGRQVRGSVLKDSGSTGKLANEFNISSNKKTENGQGIAKAETDTKWSSEQREDTSGPEESQMLMDDSRNGLKTTSDLIKLPQEAIPPSAENEKPKEQPTELASADGLLNENSTQISVSPCTGSAEEPAVQPEQVTDGPIGVTTAPVENTTNSVLDSGNLEMGNKQSTMKEQPVDISSAEEAQPFTNEDSTTLPSNHVDSDEIILSSTKTDEIQINGSEELHADDTTEKLTQENEKPKIAPKEVDTYIEHKPNLQIEDTQPPLPTDNTRSDVSCVTPDDKPYSESINEDNQDHQEPTKTKEIPYREEPLKDSSSVQGGLKIKSSSAISEEESLPAAESLTSDKITQSDEEPAKEVSDQVQNSATCTNENSSELEGTKTVAEAVCLQAEDITPQTSATDQEGITSSDVSNHILGSNGFAEDESNKEQIILNSSVAPQDQNTIVTANIADCVAKEERHQPINNECKVMPAAIDQKDDHVQNTIDLPACTEEPSSSELVVVVADTLTEKLQNQYERMHLISNVVEKKVNLNPELNAKDVSVDAGEVTKKLENTDNDHINLMHNVAERKKENFNTELHNTDVTSVHEYMSMEPTSGPSQNGFLDTPDVTIFTNGGLEHTGEFLEQNYINVHSPDNSFNVSAGGEEGVFDSSSDMEMFAETIRKLDSPITVPQKRKKPRGPKSPGPYCGLPPIREDYLEKILDNENFSFGLGKKDRTKDLAPMALFKMQSKETAEKMKPKRASAEQSMLLKSLRSQREPLSTAQETCDKENADVPDVAVKKSRIESMYSNRKSPFTAREENVFSPTVTTVSTMTTSFDTPRKEFTPSGKTCDLKTTDSVKTAHTVVREDLTVQSSDFSHSASAQQYLSTPVVSMDNHLETKDGAHADLAASLPDSNGVPEENHSIPEKKEAQPPVQSMTEADNPAGDVADIFYFKGLDQTSSVPSLSSEILSFQGAEKVNPRPGKLVILTEAECGGAVFEVFTDVADCTSWELSPTIFIKTIRGCWLLYEHPNFEGRTIALEEGDTEITNPWGEDEQEEKTQTPVLIGSLRHVVKDYRVCQIDLFTDPGGLGVMTSYFDDTEEVQVYGKLQRTCSIKVHCGVWLIYEESGFQGVPFILEAGEYPDLSFWNTQEAYIGSVRPLKMLHESVLNVILFNSIHLLYREVAKLEILNEPKIIIFEKPMFEGQQAELDKETMTFKNLEIAKGSEEPALPFTTVGSMRVLSGLWVGYEKPGYEGHQYLLEEGDYEEWNQWGGYNGLLQSLRPILSDLSTPHLVMYNEKDFDEKAANINVLGIIANMDETGFGAKIQSINVLSGVWVAYECPDFTGEQYILEKGTYSTFGDWGARSPKISSVQPIVQDPVESPGVPFKVEVFSEPNFQGENQILEGDLNNLEESFKIMSCKVASGRWLLYDQADFTGNLWVLEEGVFPDLCAMGCPHDADVRSLKIVNYEFSEPHLVLYGKEHFKGRKVKVSKEVTDLQASGYSPDLMSAEVLGGIWVFYEFPNYRGRQLLISPSKIAQWRQFSGWSRIGSLRPLKQKRLYFKLRNKSNGMMMSTNGSQDDIKLLRIQATEENGAEDQIWVYHRGAIKCRIAEECSLSTAGTLITAGTKLGLSLEEPGVSAMLWSISPEGRIYSRSKSNLVLDIKGGNQYDQQHIVLNPVTEGKLSQLWEICIL
ncbi:LOW QUALITY PROTEIN: beta/gamma crystallin domain-containing protein 1 [Hyperolius riggenbachi]|uniref:LOW QUALITY PROTEIN: beta/gamma crystallin domain-containing protein 1 n=1 Tax=Hyperolius riggenbachi TaxID=752182 RepID=UPI0035A2CCF4